MSRAVGDGGSTVSDSVDSRAENRASSPSPGPSTSPGWAGSDSWVSRTGSRAFRANTRAGTVRERRNGADDATRAGRRSRASWGAWVDRSSANRDRSSADGNRSSTDRSRTGRVDRVGVVSVGS